MKKPGPQLRRMIVSAMFLSLAVVLKTSFTFDIPLFGQNGMRIGVSGIFSAMPALLIGPAYGMIVSGLTDVLGYLFKPAGAYLPLMTAVIAAGGLVRGLLWRMIRNRNGRNLRIAVAICALTLLVFGVCNTLFLRADGVTDAFYAQAGTEDVATGNMHWVSRMVINRTIRTADPARNLATYLITMTMGLIGGAGFCLLLLCIDLLISKKADPSGKDSKAMPILISMMLPGLMITTLNTVVLRETFFPAWKLLPFSLVWIPRIIESILENAVMAYFVILLFGIFESRKNLRELAPEENWL